MNEQTTSSDTAGNAGRGTKTRLAVIGGGPSALTALYHITADPDVRSQYDITVYQMGWRVGGKGASGRREYGAILEHGLHVLFGFYENFFKMIRACYKELDRPESHPLSDWTSAFKGHNFGVVEEYFKGEWCPWALEFPSNDSRPGEGGAWDTEADYIEMMLEALFELIFGWRALHKLQDRKTIFNQHEDTPHQKHWSNPITNLAMRYVGWRLRTHLKDAQKHLRHRKIHKTLAKTNSGWLWKLILKWSNHSIASHRFWLGCDFLIAAIKGSIEDRVFEKGGFDSIDKYDFREWLTLHGIHEVTLPTPFCRTIYDAAFSYEKGDPDKQRVAAGSALRALFRMGFTYKGHAYYKMQAGMGDTVFEPLYTILRKRGVKFNFFHKAEALHLSEPDADGKRTVASVDILRQAFLKNSDDPADYEPLYPVKDLDCWPAEPFWKQLKNADALQKYDLESYYDKLPDDITELVVIREGVDYDKLLYAIPIGTVPFVAEELVNDSQDWQLMVQNVQSVTTVAFQLWFSKNYTDLGWKLPDPLLSLYVEPLNTWADMSQVIPREDWPSTLEVKDISYYCGPQEGPTFVPDPRDPANANFEKEQYAVAWDLAAEFCEKSIGGLMPDAVAKDGPPVLDWSLLVDPENREGKARFASQYARSNCGPSERCTLALPGATQHRMKAGDTGYSNLVITGDWIANGLNVACMEGAITSGIYAARAITGIDFEIIGEELNQM